MAYKVIILYQLYMPSYFLGTFTEYPYLINNVDESSQGTEGGRMPSVLYFVPITTQFSFIEIFIPDTSSSIRIILSKSSYFFKSPLKVYCFTSSLV